MSFIRDLEYTLKWLNVLYIFWSKIKYTFAIISKTIIIRKNVIIKFN